MIRIGESDWRLFRELQRVALERFCERALKEVERTSVDSTKSFHERYLAIFKLIERRDRELGRAFDNPRRSTALMQLTRMYSQKLLTAEEFERFSQNLRDAIAALLS